MVLPASLNLFLMLIGLLACGVMITEGTRFGIRTIFEQEYIPPTQSQLKTIKENERLTAKLGALTVARDWQVNLLTEEITALRAEREDTLSMFNETIQSIGELTVE